jgi:hypothetical protein
MSEQLDGFGHMSCDNLCAEHLQSAPGCIHASGSERGGGPGTIYGGLGTIMEAPERFMKAWGRFMDAWGRFMEARGRFKETPVEADVTLLESTLILEIRQVRHKLRQNRQTFAIIRLEAIARADKPDQGHSGN